MPFRLGCAYASCLRPGTRHCPRCGYRYCEEHAPPSKSPGDPCRTCRDKDDEVVGRRLLHAAVVGEYGGKIARAMRRGTGRSSRTGDKTTMWGVCGIASSLFWCFAGVLMPVALVLVPTGVGFGIASIVSARKVGRSRALGITAIAISTSLTLLAAASVGLIAFDTDTST